MKRWTATEKWNNPWHRKLPIVYKCFWDYLCSQCDPAGVWRVDFEAVDFQLGAGVDPQEALDHFGGRVFVFDGGKRWWLVPFVTFQQGPIREDTKCGPHLKIIDLLKKYGLWSKYAHPESTLNLPSYEGGNESNIIKNKKEEEKSDVEPIINAWCALHPKKRRPKSHEKAYAKIRARLRAGRTAAEIIKAIKGNAGDDFYRKINKHELTFICQSCDRLDQLIAKFDAQTPPKPKDPRPWLHFTDALRNCPDCIAEAEQRLKKPPGSARMVTPSSPKDELIAWIDTIHEVRDDNPSM